MTAFVLLRLDGAKLDTGAARGFGSVEAGAHQIVDIGVDMETQFSVHVALEPLAAKDLHDSSATASRTPATTVEKRFQESVSALRRLRPAAVSL